MTEQDFQEGYFTFRRFRVRQTDSSMKVGTDAVLLGSWMSLPSSEKTPELLDIGTGCGVISLFAAQRLSSACDDFHITGIDSDPSSAREAALNFAESPWAPFLNSIDLSLRQYTSTSEEGVFDSIFSNPPYFINSLKAPDLRRSSARHTDSLPFSELIECSGRLLKNGGVLSVILPPDEGKQFCSIARAHERSGGRFTLSRLCRVYPSAGKPLKRLMMEFIWSSGQSLNTPVPAGEDLILQEGTLRTPEYKLLTEDFYVK